MLYIYYGDHEDVINRSDIYFNSTYQDEWFEDELVREIILSVDRSSVISPHLIESPVLGPIGPKDLSGGTKTLILMYKDKEHIFNATNCGDSATGKTTMLEMLDNYVRLGYESGIHVECDVPVDTYMTDNRRSDWKTRLETMEGSIVFIEEMNIFIKTREFAEYVSKSDSYYVLVSRWDLKNLPYSVEEIYKLTEKGKYPKAKQVYNSLEKY